MFQTIQSWNWTLIFGVLFGLSEAIGMIPSVQASSVFQAIVGVLKWAKGIFVKPPAA